MRVVLNIIRARNVLMMFHVCTFGDAVVVLEYFSVSFCYRTRNGVGRINEVTLRRARLVVPIRWVTCLDM